MVEQVLVKKFQPDLSSNPGWGGFFLNREKQLFAMNPGQDLNYHTEICISDLL